MNLDLTTLYVFSGLVIVAVAAMFILEVVRRGITPVDRIWTLALSSALATAVCYAAAASLPAAWWCVGLGNGASVLTTFAMWSGIRAYNGQRPLLGVGATLAAVVALVAVVQGPAAGEWAGGGAMIAGTGVGALLAAATAARGRMRLTPSGPVLAGVLTMVWLYYIVRLTLFLTQGPYSTAFRTYAGTELTTLLLTLLVLTAAVAMVSARGDHVLKQRQGQQHFDPMTGARTPESFRRRGTELLEEARGSCHPVAVAAVIVQDVPTLVTAFGIDQAEQAVVIVGERCGELAPPPALVGRAATDAESFDILLVGRSPDEVGRWAEQLRKRVIDSPLALPSGSVRLRVSIGVATDAEGVQDLTELCARATEQARAVLDRGGNRVVVASA